MFVIGTLIMAGEAYTQSVPAKEENIPYLVTFGNKAETSYGDDDFTQVFFFSIPKYHKKPIYLRIYDPDVGGEIGFL